jgi:hypothetical protein
VVVADLINLAHVPKLAKQIFQRIRFGGYADVIWMEKYFNNALLGR